MQIIYNANKYKIDLEFTIENCDAECWQISQYLNHRLLINRVERWKINEMNITHTNTNTHCSESHSHASELKSFNEFVLESKIVHIQINLQQ